VRDSVCVRESKRAGARWRCNEEEKREKSLAICVDVYLRAMTFDMSSVSWLFQC
jgi:hypothetical protein